MALLPVVAARAQTSLDQLFPEVIPGNATQPGVTVLSRTRPEYDSPGFQAGEVTIRPQLTESLGFEDNVLGTQSPRGSAIVETRASISALYDHSDVTGTASINVDDNRYPDLPGQNFTDWGGLLGLRRSLGNDLLDLSYTHQTLYQTTRDLDVPELTNPLQYRADNFQASYKLAIGRVFLQPGIAVSLSDYDNGVANSVTYLQNYRDRITVEPSITVGYQLAPQRNLVLSFQDAVASYSNKIAGSPGRNFNDRLFLAGLDFTEGSVWRYRVLIGYQERSFTSSQVSSISSPIVKAQATWNSTGLTTVTGSLIRQIQDSADEGTVAVTTTSLQLQLDHELRQNVLLQGRGSFSLGQYGEGQGSQSLYTVGAGARWLLNRNAQLAASYDFTHRSSSSSAILGTTATSQQIGGSYTDNRYIVTLSLAL